MAKFLAHLKQKEIEKVEEVTKDWKMKEFCAKACLKKQAKDMFEAEETAKQSQGKQDELLKTEQAEKKTRAKAMQARKPTMASMNTKLVVS